MNNIILLINYLLMILFIQLSTGVKCYVKSIYNYSSTTPSFSYQSSFSKTNSLQTVLQQKSNLLISMHAPYRQITLVLRSFHLHTCLSRRIQPERHTYNKTFTNRTKTDFIRAKSSERVQPQKILFTKGCTI